MTASGNKSLPSVENKKDCFDDAAPYEIMKLPQPVVKIVAGYAWETPLQKPCLFSDVDYLLEKIFYYAQYAGPLEQFKNYVARFLEKELAKKSGRENILLKDIVTIGNHHGTFVQCLVIGLDQTIRSEDGKELDKGMTEQFIEVVESFCQKNLLSPEKLQAVKDQASEAAPPENKNDQAERKHAVELLFTDLIHPIEDVAQQAINDFMKFVAKMKRRSMNDKNYLTDNRYYIGIIGLMDECIDILAKRGRQLPGRHYGQRGNLLCYKVIGEFLQSLENVPPRVRQIFRLEWGLFSLFHENKKPDRTVFDVTGDVYLGRRTKHIVGVNDYFDDYGAARETDALRKRRALEWVAAGSLAGIFKTYYKQLHQRTDVIPQQRQIRRKPGFYRIMQEFIADLDL